MNAAAITILRTGLVSSVGLSAPAACAAIRARLSNATETSFLNSSGKWITAHQVPLAGAWRGRAKLVKMAAPAIEEALVGIARKDWPGIPLLLCVAERDRPGRTSGLDDALFAEVQQELGTRFSSESAVITEGRVGVAIALTHARGLITQGQIPRVLIAAADSLVSWRTLRVYEQEQRLLSAANSNGFLPGEGGGALLVGGSQGGGLLCTGIGVATEKAHIASGEPLRGEGLSQAIRGALLEAGCELGQLDLRITDLSGEHYYFKEAALAVARCGYVSKENLDLWHPAECIGESGALAGLTAVVVAEAACRKSYAEGPCILFHASNDNGARAAAVLQYGESA